MASGRCITCGDDAGGPEACLAGIGPMGLGQTRVGPFCTARCRDAYIGARNWAITVPSCLHGAPLVTVAYDANTRVGYIEVPVFIPDGDGVTEMRARCPVARAQLDAIARVLSGWPIQ